MLVLSWLLALTACAQTDSSQKGNVDSLSRNEMTTRTEGEEPVFEKLQVKPKVDAALWRSNMEAKLLPVIDSAIKQKISPSKYTIMVRFIVEKDGTVTNVKAMNDPGFGLAKGAEDIIRTGPKWQAGEQNKRKVRSYFMQPIVFVIEEETESH